MEKPDQVRLFSFSILEFEKDESMNRRLRAIASLVQGGTGLIDVGTDHGQLPVYLINNGYTGVLFASDINSGPLAAAKKTAEQAGAADRIRFLCCDGLRLCPPDEIDTIVIAGMGGDLIVKILDEAEWCMESRYRLILQPMTKAEVLRYWLVNNGFGIHAEILAEDGSILYQIISASFGGTTKLSDAELFAGKRELCNDPDAYERHLEAMILRFQSAVAGMTGAGKDPRLPLYRDILAQMIEIKEEK